jgi:hypothetical protein
MFHHWINGRISFTFRVCRSRRAPLQRCEEETVGSRFGWGQNDATLFQASSIRCLRKPGAPQRCSLDEREIRVAREETLHLPVVFSRKDRAGYVDEPAARLHKRTGFLEYIRLLAQPHVELALGEPPFRIRTSSPCAATGAGRVDEDEVHLTSQRRKPADIGDCLYVSGTRTAEPIENRRKALFLGVVGEDLAAIAHRCR